MRPTHMPTKNVFSKPVRHAALLPKLWRPEPLWTGPRLGLGFDGGRLSPAASAVTYRSAYRALTTSLPGTYYTSICWSLVVPFCLVFFFVLIHFLPAANTQISPQCHTTRLQLPGVARNKQKEERASGVKGCEWYMQRKRRKNFSPKGESEKETSQKMVRSKNTQQGRTNAYLDEQQTTVQ